MGYTHYFTAKKTLGTKEQWNTFVLDCKKIFDYCQEQLEINLANSSADENSQPEIDMENDCISFNGSEQQRLGVWTTDEEISIPWPSDDAICNEPNADPIAKKTDGNWFAGTLLKQRVAPKNDENGLGRGSYEPLVIKRVPYREYGFCKTAFRPYDLTVTAILISAKHHFKDNIIVMSDGNDTHWLDGKILCNNVLGYGLDFTLDDE